MTPNLAKLLVRPALKRWLLINGYGWQEDYPIAEGLAAEVYATSQIHAHAMAVLPLRAVTPATLNEVVARCRTLRAALPGSALVAVAVPQDGIIEHMRLKLVAQQIRVIVLESVMTQKAYEDWMRADWRKAVPLAQH